MNVIIVCTEGENSEPAFILNYGRCVFGQTCPDAIVIAIPLKGNHGHAKIFDAADKAICREAGSEDSWLSLLGGEGDHGFKRFIICDYDKMEKHGIDEESFKEMARQRNYRVIINKPNFEFFVLTYLTNTKHALRVKPEDYGLEIDKAVDVLNERNRRLKGFSEGMDIPHYSKNRYAAKMFFAKLLDYNRVELDRKFCKCGEDFTGDAYTQMWDIMAEVRRYAAERDP